MSYLSLKELGRLELGGGSATVSTGQAARLMLPPKPSGYADAQLDDTAGISRSRFRWRPPLRLRLRARASHGSPPGTLGFGFWNDPFALSLGQGGAARRLPSPPQTVWYFYTSPPGDLRFTAGMAGNGWKAMHLVTRPTPTLVLMALAPAAIVLAQVRRLRRPILRRALARVHGAEAALDLELTQWHTYQIDWEPTGAAFMVDGRLVLRSQIPAAGPLGFVTWIDNQYATATPEAGFRFGSLATSEPQWLEIEEFALAES